LKSRAAVEQVAEAGADAVLVGTHLAGHRSPETAVRAIAGVPTMARSGVRQ
jgi:indole-3-glycerol phosphate synthase